MKRKSFTRLGKISNTLIPILITLALGSVPLQATIRMGLVSDVKYCGERELAYRIKIAGEGLGWTVVLDESKGEMLQTRSDLDFVICLLPENEYFHPSCPNYLTIFHPFNYLDRARKLLPFYEKYDGYLLTINDGKSITRLAEQENYDFYSIPFFPSLYPVEYREVALSDLVIIVPAWGNRVNDIKYKTLFYLLSRLGEAKFYGLERNSKMIRSGYMGELPFDGTSVIEVLQNHGITLVIHSDVHQQEGIPSPRIFEAAAASVVIISDENQFVKEHFGDSVFYIDTSLQAVDIYRQIQRHLKTIRKDPATALAMAKKAHQIFTDHFLMTDQLLELELMHRTLQSKENIL